jgi:arginase
MNISITNVHLDLGAGRRGTDMGPSAIHVAGLVPKLQSLGHTVVNIDSVGTASYESLEADFSKARFLPQIKKVCSTVKARIEANCENGLFSLVLGGDHAQAIGTISGIMSYHKKRNQRVGVVWVDAHTDSNTPNSSPSGNIHGMPVATLLGHGHPDLVALNPDGQSIRPEDIVIIGARDVDATEVPLVKELGIRVYTMSELDRRGAALCFKEAIDYVSEGTSGLHLSFDLDGVDPSEAPGVGTPVMGGLSLRESHLICEMMCSTKKLMSMEMVELNPTLDIANKTGHLAVWLIQSALGKTIL